MTTFTTYTSKTLGGLVVDHAEVFGPGTGTRRGVLRTNGTATVYFRPSADRGFTVASTGKKAERWVREMLAEAKAATEAAEN